jgi:hypothetical protein
MARSAGSSAGGAKHVATAGSHYAGQGAGDASTTWMRRPKAGPADPDMAPEPGDEVAGAGEILSQLDTI